MLGILANSFRIATRNEPREDPQDFLLRQERQRRRRMELDAVRFRQFLGEWEGD